MKIDLIYHSIRQRDASWQHDVKIRNWNVLFLVKEGSFEMFLGGNKRPLILQKNSVIYLSPNTPFSRRARTPSKVYTLSFRTEEDHPFCRDLTSGELRVPQNQLEGIFSDLDQAAIIPNNREIMTHTIEHILAEHFLHKKEKNPKATVVSKETLKIIEYMNKHLSEKIDINELAEQFYLSHTGLIYKFRHDLDTTPSQYLILLRMRYAKQLLLNEKLSIKEVAEQCGYNNPFYFTNAFRNYAGMSPSEFKQHYINQNEE